MARAYPAQSVWRLPSAQALYVTRSGVLGHFRLHQCGCHAGRGTTIPEPSSLRRVAFLAGSDLGVDVAVAKGSGPGRGLIQGKDGAGFANVAPHRTFNDICTARQIAAVHQFKADVCPVRTRLPFRVRAIAFNRLRAGD